MNIGKFTSVAKLLDHMTQAQPQDEQPKFQSLQQSPSSQSQLFKMLFKYIHPTSTIISSSKFMSQNNNDKKYNDISTDAIQQKSLKESSIININSLQAICLTRMGIRNYDNMVNQDVILEDQISNKCKIFGIFDGHGEYGKIIAQTAKNIFQNLLQKYSEDIKNQNSMLSIQTIIKKVLEKTNSYLLHYKVQQAQFSGTTALIVLITPKKIYTFNIGNSRAVLGKFYAKTQKIQPFQLTHDHTITRFDERLRILQCGGVIGPYKNERGQQIGPERIWAKNQAYPGMFVTRTLGLSCAYKLGVISEPQISIIQYDSNHKFLILGSDGLWTVQQNDEAVKFLQKLYKSQLQIVSNSLMIEAVKRWRMRNELMDDITMIIIPLESVE